MKKILILLLLMVSTSVFAEWTVLGSGAYGTTFYADFGTIKRIGNKVKIWSLLDFKTVQKVENYKFLSQMVRSEYDCEEETMRILDVYLYSGNMRGSGIVFSDANIKKEAWSVTPDTIDEGLFKIACDKK